MSKQEGPAELVQSLASSRSLRWAPPSPSLRQRALVAGSLTALLLLLASGGLSRKRWAVPESLKNDIIPVSDLAEDLRDAECTDYPSVKFLRIVHSNLGGQGPDTGAEGVLIEAIYRNGSSSQRVDVVINATTLYTTTKPLDNGLEGPYMTLNLKAGSSVSLRISITDAATHAKVIMTKVAITFLGLDTGGMFGGVRTCTESVSASGFESYNLSKETELETVRNTISTTFKATKEGNRTQHPADTVYLTKQQQNRAVTFMYTDTDHMDITYATSHGSGPRFFTFIMRPSLLCAITLQPGERPPISQLDYFPPLDLPVIAGPNETFQDWFVKDGEAVAPSHHLCTVTLSDGSAKLYQAPREGTVRIQDRLKTGDDLDRILLTNRILAVVSLHMWPALNLDAEDAATLSPSNMKFKGWRVAKGALVKKGDPLVDIQDADGKVTTLQATKDGVVKACQHLFKEGDPVERASDLNLMTVGKFASLNVRFGEAKTEVPPGMKFERWRVKVGDVVKKGAIIADISKNDGKDWSVATASKDGILTSRQEQLMPGMEIDKLMMDRNLAVVGKFAPLKVNSGEVATNSQSGMFFKEFLVKRGDEVSLDVPIAILSDAVGAEFAIKPSKAGLVMATQQELQSGMSIDDAMQDLNLATIGRLPPLAVGIQEKPVRAPSMTATFKEWKTQLGAVVREGDDIAVIVDSTGSQVVLPSPKYGIVKSRQELLQQGFNIGDVMTDTTLAVIGKFPAVQVGFLQTAVEAPDGAVFDGWCVQDGEHVNPGDPIAQVVMPVRRLQDTSIVVHGDKKNVTAPVGGSVGNLAPLNKGTVISDAMEGSVIATVSGSLPWWQVFAGILCLSLWVCFLGFFKVMRKPRPIYNHLIFDEALADDEVEERHHEPAPAKIVVKEKPKGLRLDFSDIEKDRNTIRTFYVHWRPLGILHDNKAPIIARGFTVNSYAKTLGVREGWKLTRIDDTELHDTDDFDGVNALLTSYLSDLPLWPLPIAFQVDDSSHEVHTVKFEEHPIGLEFANEAPIKVCKVLPDSPAEKLKIQEGWYIVRIGEMDVGKNTNFREVMGYLKQGVMALVDNGKKYQTSVC